VHIIYALTKHIDDTSPNDSKARLLAKFLENDGEKCDRVVELCLKYDNKMRQAEFNYYKSDEAEEAEMNGVDVDLAALNAKLQGGGDLFHRLSAIIAFISVNSKRCHRYILEQLHTQNSGIGIIKTGLDEFVGILHNGHHRDELVQFSSQL
jgi:beta-catenin-like protein 1